MFDIGWSELLLVAVVAILVVGPKDLPRLMHTFGKYAGKLRRVAADFQSQLSEAVAEDELKEVGRSIESIRSSTGSIDLKAPMYKPWSRPKLPNSAASPPENEAQNTIHSPDTHSADLPIDQPSVEFQSEQGAKALKTAPSRRSAPRREEAKLAAHAKESGNKKRAGAKPAKKHKNVTEGKASRTRKNPPKKTNARREP